MVSRINLLKSCAFLLFTLVISGCVTTPAPAERSELAVRLAYSAGMTKVMLNASGFTLVAYERIDAPGKPLHVYIEGDGLAWKSRRRLSDNPTPTDPLALRLAVQDPAENVAYLARPCQYLETHERRRCTRDHWSMQRFSEDVIAASNQAISQLRERSGSSGLHLIGYSGGGAMAALVAARRGDVLSLRTVAGNLDHASFTTLHGVTPLTGSLNPAAYGRELENIPQRHFIGTEDAIMPGSVAGAYMRRLPTQRCVSLTSVPGASHTQGWVDGWRQWLALPVACKDR